MITDDKRDLSQLPYITFVKFTSGHVLPSAPFCCGNMSEPGTDQHHSRAEHEISFTNIKERRFRPAGDQLVQLDRSRSRTCTEPAAPIFSYSCCRSKHLSVTALAMTNSAEREVLLPGKPTIRYPWIPQTLAKKKMLRYSNRIQNQKGI